MAEYGSYKLIVIIVRKGLSRRVMRACRKAGAEGATVLQGRGAGTHEQDSILGIRFEPEKDIILCLTDQRVKEKVLSKVNAAARLDRPGTGIAFVLKSSRIAGIAHKFL